ncbi:MAG: GtrA family protein [Sphingomonas sp.]
MSDAGVIGRYRLQLSSFLAKPAAKQLVRYVIAGMCVTQFAAGIYSALVLYFAINPFQANLASTACGLAAAYMAHSRWSFVDGAAEGDYARLGRFLLTALVSFLVNSTWVWLLVSTLHLPPLTPVPLMILVTPWVSFLLNRYWVFQAA